MFLDRLSQNIVSFRQRIILGILVFLIVFASFFSGEWNNWLVAVFFVLIFPLVFYSFLLWRDAGQPPLFSLSFRSPKLYALFFLLVGLLTAFSSVMKYDSFHYWTLLLAYMIVFFVAGGLGRDFSKVKVIALAIFFTGVAASLINLILFLQDPTTRAGGALLNANALGGYFLFSVPLGIVLAIDQPGGRLRKFFIGGTLLTVVSFFLTFSYTSWISFLLPAGLILVLYRRRIFTRRRLFLSGLIVAVLVVIAVGFRFASTKDFSQAIALHRTISSSGLTYSFDQRLNFIRATADIFYDNVGWGTGLATFQQVYPRYALTVLEQPRYAHNYYLQTAAETGVFGLLALLGFVVTMLLMAYRVARKYFSDPVRWPYVLGLGLGLLGSAIHALFDFSWQFPAVFLLFWIAGGVLSGQESVPTVLPGQQSPGKKYVFRIGVAFMLTVSLVLLVRGVTLCVAQSYHDRAEVKKLNAHLDEALPLNRLAARLSPAPDVLRSYADTLFRIGVEQKDQRQEYYREADQLYGRIVRWNPSEYFAYHEAGKMYFMRKEYALAEDNYRQAITHDPVFHPDFYYDLAFLYYTHEQYDEAIALILPIVDRYAGVTETSNPRLPTQLSFLHLLAGRAYAEQGEVISARQHYESALRLVPDFDLAKQELDALPAD